jgi:sugar (pentulose or hexulose) kinase
VSEPSVVVTLDIGGSAAKATAYDIRARATLATTSTPYPAIAGTGDPGLFDPLAWWSSALRALSSLANTLDLAGHRYLGVTVSATGVVARRRPACSTRTAERAARLASSRRRSEPTRFTS